MLTPATLPPVTVVVPPPTVPPSVLYPVPLDPCEGDESKTNRKIISARTDSGLVNFLSDLLLLRSILLDMNASARPAMWNNVEDASSHSPLMNLSEWTAPH